MFNIGGEKLMSLREALEYELNHRVSLKESNPWSEGYYTTDFLCPRLFSDGEVYYAPMEDKDNPIYMAATPIGDNNWKQLPKDFMKTEKKFRVGDKVKLPEDSEFLFSDGDFHLKGIGYVYEVDEDDEYPVKVSWFDSGEDRSNDYNHEDLIFAYEESPEASTQQSNTLSEQSIAEAIKTLSQASQEIQTKFSVNSEGELTIYSNYHEKELTFNLDRLDQLMQYIECVKNLDKFK